MTATEFETLIWSFRATGRTPRRLIAEGWSMTEIVETASVARLNAMMEADSVQNRMR